MATYAELAQLSENETLRLKVRVACVIAAEAIRTEPAITSLHTERSAWAKSVFANPEAVTQRMVWAVLAQNASATPAAISGATDATVQSAVNAAVNVFVL